MKAPDIVESWKWLPAESIIERLLALSSRTIGAQVIVNQRPVRDRYYTRARQVCVRQAMRSGR